MSDGVAQAVLLDVVETEEVVKVINIELLELILELELLTAFQLAERLYWVAEYTVTPLGCATR